MDTEDLILVPRQLFVDLIEIAERGHNGSLPLREVDRNFIRDTLQAAVAWESPVIVHLITA